MFSEACIAFLLAAVHEPPYSLLITLADSPIF
jgi:hypothetical protein